LLLSLLFLMLTARLDISAMLELGWAGLLVFLIIQFVGRPLNVLVSVYKSKLSSAEKTFLAWIAPRGIVAAAISSLFAIRLEEAGFIDARYLVPLTFTIIIGTVVLQSLTAAPLARFLKVAEPEPRGFLIIGAHRLGRAVARALQQNEVPVLLADTNWERVEEAQEDGLEVYHGSPISEHADRYMNLDGIGRMIALTPHRGANVAAAMHYRAELGRDNVFVIHTTSGENLKKSKERPARRNTRLFLEDSLSYENLDSIIKNGGTIETVTLDEESSYEDVAKTYEKKGAIILFFIDGADNIYLNNEDKKGVLGEGWSMIVLLPPDQK
jgi:NhaP-type Na+/H+ or K+/H+ antiporter